MLHLTFNPGLTLTGFRATRPWCFHERIANEDQWNHGKPELRG